jgi:hypothetical protein
MRLFVLSLIAVTLAVTDVMAEEPTVPLVVGITTKSQINDNHDKVTRTNGSATDDASKQPSVSNLLVKDGEAETRGSEQTKDYRGTAGFIFTGERDALKRLDSNKGDQKDVPPEQFGSLAFRHRFLLPHFRGGYYDWRYPLWYWNQYGFRLFGSQCQFGRIIGDFFYC